MSEEESAKPTQPKPKPTWLLYMGGAFFVVAVLIFAVRQSSRPVPECFEFSSSNLEASLGTGMIPPAMGVLGLQAVTVGDGIWVVAGEITTGDAAGTDVVGAWRVRGASVESPGFVESANAPAVANSVFPKIPVSERPREINAVVGSVVT